MKYIIRIVIAFAFFWLLAFAHVSVISIPYPAVNDFAFWEKGDKFFDLFMTAVSFGALTSIIFCIKALFFSPNSKKYLLPVCASVFPIILGYLGSAFPDQVYTLLQYIYMGIFGISGIIPALFYGVFTFGGMGATVTLVVTLVVSVVCGIWGREIFRAFFRGFADSSRKASSGGTVQNKPQSSGTAKMDKDFARRLKAADRGDAEMQAYVGDCYLKGTGVDRDLDKAMKYYRMAAEQKNTTALLRLGRAYEEGDLVTQDYQKAVHYYRLAVENGSYEAMFDLGNCYSYGTGVEQNDKKALECYLAAADHGSRPAQFLAGNMYDSGKGTEVNYEKAVKYFQLAADQNDSNALYCLGKCYECGKGVETDYAKAFSYYQEAVKDETIPRLVYYTIGECYRNGRGVKRDYGEAVRNYQIAADDGDAEAQFALAVCYQSGNGVASDGEKSLEYMQMAVENKSEAAFVYYAVLNQIAQDQLLTMQDTLMFLEKVGIKYPETLYTVGLYYASKGENEKAAEIFFSAAAEREYADAQFALAQCYEAGIGVEEDVEKALELYQKAADQGHEKARNYLELHVKFIENTFGKSF